MRTQALAATTMLAKFRGISKVKYQATTIYYLNQSYPLEALDSIILRCERCAFMLQSLSSRLETLLKLIRDLESQMEREDSPFSSLLMRHAESLGYSPQMLQWGFKSMFQEWNEEAIKGLLRSQAPKIWDKTSVFSRLFLITASSVPPAAWQDLFLPLLVPVVVIFKAASKQRAFFYDFFLWLSLRYPELSAAIVLIQLDNENHSDLKCILSQVDAVSLASNDQTLNHFKRQIAALEVSQRPHLIAYPHRVSAAIITKNELPTLSTTQFYNMALDIRVWDLFGCLSPNCIFLEANEGEARRFVSKLKIELLKWEEALPSQRLSDKEQALLNLNRRNAAIDAVLFEETTHCSIFVFDETTDAAPLSPPNNLNIYLCQNAMHALQKLSPHGQCLANSEELPTELKKLAQSYGFQHFCTFGEMQKPKLSWNRDGLGNLKPLFRAPTT